MGWGGGGGEVCDQWGDIYYNGHSMRRRKSFLSIYTVEPIPILWTSSNCALIKGGALISRVNRLSALYCRDIREETGMQTIPMGGGGEGYLGPCLALCIWCVSNRASKCQVSQCVCPCGSRSSLAYMLSPSYAHACSLIRRTGKTLPTLLMLQFSKANWPWE